MLLLQLNNHTQTKKMTRFVADAIAHRHGGGGARKGGGEAARKAELDEFKKTGVHPEQRAARASAADAPLPLPPADPSRPHLALDLALDGRPLGRAVVEVFEDAVPLAAAQLLRRCAPGSPVALAGTAASRLIRLSAAYWPAAAGAASSSAPSAGAGARPALDTNAAARRARFCAAGVVGVARDGSGAVAVSLGRSPTLDATHVVVGRVARWIGGATGAAAAAAAKGESSGGGGNGGDGEDASAGGRELAAALNALRTNAAGDAPAGRLVVSRCGRSDARGGAADDGGAAGESAAAAAAKPSAKELRAGVDEALREGLLKRRGGPAAAAGGGRGGGAPAAKRRTMLDALSGSDEDDSSSGSGSSNDEEGGGGGGG